MHTTHNNNSDSLFTPFQWFKYAVYLLLVINTITFYREESAAALLMHPNGVEWDGIINAYAATIDTAAWVVLLLLFELETWTIPDEKLTPGIQLLFKALRAICYSSIVYAFYGYLQSWQELSQWQALNADVSQLCDYVGSSFMYSLERFELVSATNCLTLGEAGSLMTIGNDLLTDDSHYFLAQTLAIADVANSAAWILVVCILEVEVWLLAKGPLSVPAFRSIKFVKIALYGTLIAIAVFWGFYGEFIDFWDAFVWIVAFFFIENNVAQWQEEKLEEAV